MKYRVALEASAAVGVELEFETPSAAAAIRTAEMWLGNPECQRKLSALVDDLMSPSAEAVAGYAETTGMTLTHATCSLGENGFEVVDAFLPDAVSAAPVLSPLEVLRELVNVIKDARADEEFTASTNDAGGIIFGDVASEALEAAERLVAEAEGRAGA